MDKDEQKKKRPVWAFVSVALGALGLFFRFALRGYVYWGYLCFFLIALILAHHFLPAVLWRILLGLTCVGVVFFCIVEISIIRNARTDPDPERPYLIVLGAAVYGDRPSLTLVRRLEGARDYLLEYPKSTVIVSGGMGKGETVPEGDAMRDWLIQNGIPEERILTETAATSTRENLAYSFALRIAPMPAQISRMANRMIMAGCITIRQRIVLMRHRSISAPGVRTPSAHTGTALRYAPNRAFLNVRASAASAPFTQPSPMSARPAQ